MEEIDKDIITQNRAEDEIDLIEIVSKLWAKKTFIIKTTVIFMAIGLFIALSSPNEYSASTTMVPQTGQKSTSGSLGGLAAIAGINLGSLNSGEVLSPNVYPQILNNINYQKELLYTKFTFEKANDAITYFEYYTDKKYKSFSLFANIKKFTIGLPVVISEMIKGSHEEDNLTEFSPGEIQKLTFDEKLIIKQLFDNLLLEINTKEGYITLTFKSAEPKLSAEVVQSAQKLLQKYITEFKLQKVQNNLDFINNSYREAKKNFEEKQAELANFRDRNKSLSSAIAKTQEEKLTSEYNLLLSIYTELAKQREQAKISVTETTPILTIIKPAFIPVDKSGPRRSFILISFTIIGIIAGTGWVFVYPLLINFIDKIKNT